MALKDIWIDQDNTMDAEAEVINSIAHAVIDIEENASAGDTNLSDKQIANINKIPDIEETANIAALSAKFAQEVASQALNDASFAKNSLDSLQVEVTFAKNQADAANAKANDAYTKAETAQNAADSIVSEHITVLNNKTQVLSLQMETKQDKLSDEQINAINSIGDIETALDAIITIQNKLMGVSE